VPPHQVLANVVAVVGCDGSGKSKLTADLVARFGDRRRIKLIYLGQSSGHIGRWIQGLPVIGRPFGRYLLRKAEGAQSRKGAAPDTATTLAIYLLSQWRAYKFRRMLALGRRGVVVITDRYPQAEVPGFHFDGPGLGAVNANSWLARTLAARELRLYQWMASHVPALVIRLNIDADTAHARKPEHRMSVLRDKVAVIPTLRFNDACVLDVDGREPYAQVIDKAWNAVSADIKTPPH